MYLCIFFFFFFDYILKIYSRIIPHWKLQSSSHFFSPCSWSVSGILESKLCCLLFNLQYFKLQSMSLLFHHHYAFLLLVIQIHLNRRRKYELWTDFLLIKLPALIVNGDQCRGKGRCGGWLSDDVFRFFCLLEKGWKVCQVRVRI